MGGKGWGLLLLPLLPCPLSFTLARPRLCSPTLRVPACLCSHSHSHSLTLVRACCSPPGLLVRTRAGPLICSWCRTHCCSCSRCASDRARLCIRLRQPTLLGPRLAFVRARLYPLVCLTFVQVRSCSSMLFWALVGLSACSPALVYAYTKYKVSTYMIVKKLTFIV